MQVKAIKVAGLSSPLIGFVLSQEIWEVKAIPKGEDPQTVNNQQRVSNIGTDMNKKDSLHQASVTYTISFLTA